ncbi:MAG: TOBE domain-containing protein, partial [Halanaeroarchaeum sp.]
FIGEPSMNFFEGVIEDRTVSFGPFDISTDGMVTDRRGDYIVGVRPQDWEVTEAPQDGSWEASVLVAEPLGQKTVVDVEVEGTEVRTVTRKGFGKQLATGETVGIGVSVDGLYLFDPETEAAVYTPDRE